MLIKLWYHYRILITMAVQSKALTAFHCSNTGTVILKPTKEADEAKALQQADPLSQQ